jgi:hypothetical protein
MEWKNGTDRRTDPPTNPLTDQKRALQTPPPLGSVVYKIEKRSLFEYFYHISLSMTPKVAGGL